MIAENTRLRKSNAQALAVESVLPGLLAMARWAPRRLSIEHFALACDFSYSQAQRSLAKLQAKNLVTAIKTTRAWGNGAGVKMHGLTKKGHALLCDTAGWSRKFRTLCAEVPHGQTFNHDHMTLAAMIVAEREIDALDDFDVVRRLAEFRWDEENGQFPTSDFIGDEDERLKWDASLTIGHEKAGSSMAYLIETDMGTEQIQQKRYGDDNSITGKLLKLDRYLRQGNFQKWLSCSANEFRVLVITTSHRRIDNIFSKIDWGLFARPEKVFAFATHDEVIGSKRAGEPQVSGAFWSHDWRFCDGRSGSLISSKNADPRSVIRLVASK